MTLTYVDAGVLIVAAQGGEDRSERALTLLFDAERTFAASAFLKLEVIPQAVFHKQANDELGLAEAALREASMYGLQAMDALHVVAAGQVGARELVTLEKPARSIYRARAVKVIHLG